MKSGKRRVPGFRILETNMLIVMDKDATPEMIQGVVSKIEALGYAAQPIPGGERVAIGILRNPGPVDPALFLDMPGVTQAIPVSKPYKLVSREMKREDTVITLANGVTLGHGSFVVMAGPCAIESEDQALTIARLVKAEGAQIFRGGAFKPRTSPYSYQGMGKKGLKVLDKMRQETGLLIVTEAVDHDSLKQVAEYADIVQIGARNMQNYTLLRHAGRVQKPILLKRGMYATLDEWLMAAEYIMSEGNSQVILCERGVRAIGGHARNLLDLATIPAVRRESHLPIVVDPSHAAGRRDLVPPLARAAVAAGADGLLIEVHHEPEKALSDGAQSLYPQQFGVLMDEIRSLKPGSWN
jgi:3-deoxy-7-phosphoheptulonate synthase